MQRYRAPWIFLGITAGIVLLGHAMRVEFIDDHLPYVGYVDETSLVLRGANMVRTGDLNPGFFNYPSLPIYITAASLAVGAAGREGGLGRLDYPFYAHPDVVRVPKLVVAWMSTLTLLLSGYLAHRVLRLPPLLMLVAPAVLSLSVVFFYYSVQYVNVDMVAAFWTVVLASMLTFAIERDHLLWRSVLPGFLVGLVMASKYSLGVVVVAPLAAIALYSRRRLRDAALLVVIAGVTFLVVTPFSVLDFQTFWQDLQFERAHYRRGHAGFDGPPGLPQFVYYLAVQVADLGWASAPLALLGIAYAAVHDWRRTAVLLAIPLAILVFLSQYRVHFVRNALAVHVFYATFAAVGLFAVCRFICAGLARLAARRLRRATTAGAAAVAIAVFVIGLPVARPLQWLELPPDTRQRGVEWLLDHAPQGAVVVVPEELYMDTRDLDDHVEVVPVAILELDRAGFRRFLAETGADLVIVPRFHHDRRKPGGEEEAARLNEYVDEYRIVAEFENPRTAALVHSTEAQPFSGRGVLVNYVRPVPGTNPAFVIASPSPDDS